MELGKGGEIGGVKGKKEGKTLETGKKKNKIDKRRKK